MSKDLLFDCSPVLENAKLRIVLQSIEFANRPVPEKFCIFRIILPCIAFITPRYLSPVFTVSGTSGTLIAFLARTHEKKKKKRLHFLSPTAKASDSNKLWNRYVVPFAIAELGHKYLEAARPIIFYRITVLSVKIRKTVL